MMSSNLTAAEPASEGCCSQIQNEVGSTNFNVLQEITHIQNHIDNLVQSYSLSKDHIQSYYQLTEIEKGIESIFTPLQRDLLESELKALTFLCRRVNEDLDLQHIRELYTLQRINCGKKGSRSSFDFLEESESGPEGLSTADEVDTPKKEDEGLSNSNEGSIPSPSNALNKSPNICNNQSKSLPHLEQLKIKALREPSDLYEDGDVLSVEPLDDDIITKIEQRNLLARKLIQNRFESMLAQMKYEYSEHAIDRAYHNLETIREFMVTGNLDMKMKEEFEAVLNEIENRNMMEDIERYYQEMNRVLKELNDEQGYILESNKKNHAIKYKNLPEGKVSIKMEATIDVPLKTLLRLFYEPDGYKMWAPFCKESAEIKKLFRAGTCMKLKWNLPPPVASREGYMIGVGFERLEENGSFLLLSKTIHDDKQIQQRYDINVPSNSKFTRLDIYYVGVELKPLTKNKTRMNIVAMFDMKIKMIPSSVMSWIVRKGAGYLLDKIVTTASKQKETNLIGSNKNQDFYQWLDNLLQNYFQAQGLLQSSNQK